MESISCMALCVQAVLLPWILPVVAVIGLVFGFPAWVLTRNAALYAGFDTLYQQVLSIALANGDLRDPDKSAGYSTMPPREKAAYEAYAFLVFNACETIADGLDFYGNRKIMTKLERVVLFFLPVMADREFLKKTWRPVLLAEKQLHGAWLRAQQPGLRFKKEFLEFMLALEPSS